jgi:hypothetical protein
MPSPISIHPLLDRGIKPGAKDFAGGTLVCKCNQNPVKVTVKSQWCKRLRENPSLKRPDRPVAPE